MKCSQYMLCTDYTIYLLHSAQVNITAISIHFRITFKTLYIPLTYANQDCVKCTYSAKMHEVTDKTVGKICSPVPLLEKLIFVEWCRKGREAIFYVKLKTVNLRRGL